MVRLSVKKLSLPFEIRVQMFCAFTLYGEKNNGGTLAEKFDGSERAGDLRWSVCPLPLPEVAQVAVMKIVGKGGTDGCREPDDEIPRLLRTRRHGLRNAKGISRKHTANVDLVGGRLVKL